MTTPDELDDQREVLGTRTPRHVPEGSEHFSVRERLVVSPAAGVFTPRPAAVPGRRLRVGSVVGTVAGHDVCSPFEGVLEAMIAVGGQRVMPRQPIAWLRMA